MHSILLMIFSSFSLASYNNSVFENYGKKIGDIAVGVAEIDGVLLWTELWLAIICVLKT